MRKPFFNFYYHGEEQRVNMETATGEFVRVSEKLWGLTIRGAFDTKYLRPHDPENRDRLFVGFEADYLTQKQQGRTGGYYGPEEMQCKIKIRTLA